MTLRTFVKAMLLVAVLLETGFDSRAQLTEQQKSLRDYYNATYGKNEDGVFNPAPNAFLSDIVKTLKPGRALDVGMGQGRNTILLAQSGWTVTGLDISDEGIRQVRNRPAS